MRIAVWILSVVFFMMPLRSFAWLTIQIGVFPYLKLLWMVSSITGILLYYGWGNAFLRTTEYYTSFYVAVVFIITDKRKKTGINKNIISQLSVSIQMLRQTHEANECVVFSYLKSTTQHVWWSAKISNNIILLYLNNRLNIAKMNSTTNNPARKQHSIFLCVFLHGAVSILNSSHRQSQHHVVMIHNIFVVLLSKRPLLLFKRVYKYSGKP